MLILLYNLCSQAIDSSHIHTYTQSKYHNPPAHTRRGLITCMSRTWHWECTFIRIQFTFCLATISACSPKLLYEFFKWWGTSYSQHYIHIGDIYTHAKGSCADHSLKVLLRMQWSYGSRSVKVNLPGCLNFQDTSSLQLSVCRDLSCLCHGNSNW